MAKYDIYSRKTYYITDSMQKTRKIISAQKCIIKLKQKHKEKE